MRTTIARCDRCLSELESDVTVLEPVAGPLRRIRGATGYDLCPACTAALRAFLSPPRLAELEPVEAVEPVEVRP